MTALRSSHLGSETYERSSPAVARAWSPRREEKSPCSVCWQGHESNGGSFDSCEPATVICLFWACYPVTSVVTEEALPIFAASKARMSSVPVGLPSRDK